MSDEVKVDHLKTLGDSARVNREVYQRMDNPGPDLLETFVKPESPGKLVVDIVVDEFTSLCPLTGQPDFATIRIEYMPRDLCVESKSLKLYMLSFRNHGEFHEACVQRMMRDLVGVLNPMYLKVVGEFTPRGGIPFWPTSTYHAKDFWYIEDCADKDVSSL